MDLSKRRRIDFNAPVILGMAGVSLVMLILSSFMRDRMDRMFAAYFTSYTDIWMYPRLFTHVLMHANLAHYTGNFMMILAIGPMVEERYGSRTLLVMILITAFVTGLIHVIFSHRTMLMGASGIVFMLILLASFAGMRDGKIPLTAILVAVLFLGNEVVDAIGSQDSISQLSHILGGVCGALFGFAMNGRRTR